MTEPTELLPCPFCGAPAHGYAIAPHSHSPAVLRLVPDLPDHPGSYVIEGQCACGSGLIGANEAEVVARWNTRTQQPTQAVPPASGKSFQTYAEANAYSKGYYAGKKSGLSQAQAGAVPLTDEQIKALTQARSTAMQMAAEGRIPECGDFAAIAQNLDWLCDSFGIKGGQHGADT